MADWSNEPDADGLFAARDLFRSDPDAAMRKLEDLVSRGSTRAMVELAWRYSLDDSAVVNFQKAEHWYRRVIERGAKDAPYYLGVLLDKRGRHDEAFKYYRLGSDWGHSPAMYRSGWAYYKGRGIDANVSEARRAWGQASQLGHLHSRARLTGMDVWGRFGLSNLLRAWLNAPAIIADAIKIYRRDPHSDLLKE